jgi:hypothetical protein
MTAKKQVRTQMDNDACRIVNESKREQKIRTAQLKYN